MEIYAEWYGEYRRQYATVLTYCKLSLQGIRPGLYIFIRGFSRAYTPLMFVCCSAFGVEDDHDILHCSWSQFGAPEGGWWGQSGRGTLSQKLDTCELGWFAGCLQTWPCAFLFCGVSSVVFGCMGSAMNEVAPGWTVGIEKALRNKQ